MPLSKTCNTSWCLSLITENYCTVILCTIKNTFVQYQWSHKELNKILHISLLCLKLDDNCVHQLQGLIGLSGSFDFALLRQKSLIFVHVRSAREGSCFIQLLMAFFPGTFRFATYDPRCLRSAAISSLVHSFFPFFSLLRTNKPYQNNSIQKSS